MLDSLWIAIPLVSPNPVDAQRESTGVRNGVGTAVLVGNAVKMRTTGVLQTIDRSAHVRTDILDADGDLPLLDVLSTVLGRPVSVDEVGAADRPGDLPSADPDMAEGERHSIRTPTWAEWRADHPVTVIGAHRFQRGSGPTSVAVVAGPDSGFDLHIDPRTTLLSRVPTDGALLLADPCLSRSPTLLDLGASGTHTVIGSSIVVPGSVLDRVGRGAPPPPPSGIGGRDTVHVAPAAVEEPRPARPPQWWAFLIPIGIGIALALLTGMWWFLVFSLSAPLSGYLAHIVEKRRFTRESAQHLVDTALALDAAVTRAEGLVGARRRDAMEIPGLCLGFGSSISRISIAPELADRIDHFDEHAVIADTPISVDPRVTSIVVTGEHDLLLSMLLAWLADRRWEWRLSANLARRPELVGFAAASGTATATDPRTSAEIALDIDSTGTCAILRLEAPAPTATVAFVLSRLGRARTTTSTAPDGPVPGRQFTASLMPPGRFHSLVSGSSPPATAVDLHHGLGDHYDDSPSSIIGRWNARSHRPVIVGRGPAGTVSIDLFRDGPHALVAGTTGSGKSLLLQTWLLGLALEHPPDQVAFILIDFKGGATFAPLEALPHTDSVLDDFDSAAAFRALVSVRAEITRRERLLAAHGCASIDDLADPPPRLVVVIDEFHALMSTHPRAADLLEHLTALGRSLGVHLILATQRPLGIVTGQMKANINIRICLRVRDDADSLDVIGVPDAAHLPPGCPGTALLDAGSSLTRFRVAVPFAEAVADPGPHRLRLRPWSPGCDAGSTTGDVRGISVDRLVDAHRRASPTTAVSQGRVVRPPLPETDGVAARAASLDRSAAGRDQLAPRPPFTGIVDIPAEQSQYVWTFDPHVDGSVAVIGDPGSDVAAALAQMAASASVTHRIVALGRIAEIIDWAAIRCGTASGWRLHVVIDHLSRTTESAGGPEPTLVVCDHWSELVDSLDHRTAGALERLLAHAAGFGLTFLLAGCRSALLSTSTFPTRVTFPPSNGGDGLSVGLSRQRFLGTWPRLRAVLTGPRVATTGSEGADLQLRLFDPHAPDIGDVPATGTPASRTPASRPPATQAHAVAGGSCANRSPRLRAQPRWHGLDDDRCLDDATAEAIRRWGKGTVPLGVDPFGAVVDWDPARDGSVLTVRGSPKSGRTELAQRMLATGRDIHITDDAHLLGDAAALDLRDGGLHVVTMPVRFTPGYGSPLSRAHTLGPVLVIGSHTRQDLSDLGILGLPPLDGTPGTGWFVTEERTRAVRLFRAAAMSDPSQCVSAGGPVSVS